MDHLPILLAEDDDNDVFLLRRALVKAGVPNPVQAVPDGEQALAYLRGEGKFADRTLYPFPALMLLDIKMPRMNGLETLAVIRNDPVLKRLVVIFLTSSNQEQDINEAFDLRANSYLVKPRNSEGLVAVLTKFKDYWLGLNQFPSFTQELAAA
jgi:CheY-like chemotaxis protein